MKNVLDSSGFFCEGILREALSSENHYAKTTAFLGQRKLLMGLNHLAVNDANKV